MRTARLIPVVSAAVLLLWAVLPLAAAACEVCWGARVDTPTTRGIGMAMLALIGMTGLVGSGIGAFFYNMKRRSEMLQPGDLEVTEFGDIQDRDDTDAASTVRHKRPSFLEANLEAIAMFNWLDLTPYLGMPENASLHGGEIDFMMGLVHWLVIVLFLIWAPFFIYTLFRFRSSKNPKANYYGVDSHLSTYQEVGVVLAELVLLFGFAVPTWAALRSDAHYPSEEEAVVVHVIAEQFAWNIHYPGPDGVFGERDINLVDLQTNPIGLVRDDSAAADDIVTVNELHLPVNKPAIIHLTSKDVIHGFNLPIMRVKQDAIPGLSIPLYFEPRSTGESEIACAQLCGVGHYRMRGYLTIHEQADFEAWLAEQGRQGV